ncbi:MAG: histidine phosphatase family protein [Anaerolineae bacterium]|nr:histidine phosphatase family protein [Anaerolineae bacterium]
MNTIYLARHATPDWSRKDIRYDIPPGPPLVEQGKIEARQLGIYLKEVGAKKIFHSPLERTRNTAEIAAQASGLPFEERSEIIEWREDETESDLHARFWPFWLWCVENNEKIGPIALITHGGPARYMLQHLGIDLKILENHRHMYDYTNPLPPAGAWRIEREQPNAPWQFELTFKPPTAKRIS